MYLEILQKIGLSKNEAEIYESLLEFGEASVSEIAAKTNINRRNIYDVLNRMIEKGLAVPVVSDKESTFKPVDPKKLSELLEEKVRLLDGALPDLQDLYTTTPQRNEVAIYRGAEGWKNYMRDIIRIGEPAYFIGAKGAWLDDRVKDFFPAFQKKLQAKRIPMYHLFDWEVQEDFPEILDVVKDNYKFLPQGYSTPGGAVDIFGDHINILEDIQLGGFGDDDFLENFQVHCLY